MSSDSSTDILKKSHEDDPQRKAQVRIIDQPDNMGAAKAREVGIKASTGEYIIHCDSDDWLELNAYEQLYNHAKNNDCDVVIGKYYENDGNDILRIIDQCLGDNPLITVIASPLLCSLFNTFVIRSIFAEIEFIFPSCPMMVDTVL